MMLDDLTTNAAGTRPGDLATAGSADAGPMAWRDQSLCRAHPTQWWFGGTTGEVVQAKRICSGCEVAAHCLEFALARPELLGIWGATTPSERSSIRRARRTGRNERAARPGAGHLPGPVSPVTARPAHDPAGGLAGASADRRDAAAAPCETRFVPGVPGAERTTVPAAAPAPVAAVVDTDDLLTPAEAARLLGVTPNTVTRWSRAGRIAAIRTMGGHRRFRRSDIERALQTAVTESGTDFA